MKRIIATAPSEPAKVSCATSVPNLFLPYYTISRSGILRSGRRVSRRPLPHRCLACGGTPHPLQGGGGQQIRHPTSRMSNVKGKGIHRAPHMAFPTRAAPVCNKLFYNLGSKYSRFYHHCPIGMRIRQFSAIFTTNCIATTYIPPAFYSPFKTRQKATERASFCHETGMFAPRKWVSCPQQLHQLSPKSGASAHRNPHIHVRNHAFCLCQTLKQDF